MSSENESNFEFLLLVFHIQIWKDVTIIRSIEELLINESGVFCGKRKMYRKLLQCCRLSASWKKMRTRTLFKGIEVKTNILCASEHCFNMELQKVRDKKEKVDEWLLPLMEEECSKHSPVWEQATMVKKLLKAIKETAELKSHFLKLKTEWLDVVNEMNTVLDDCFERVEKLV